MEKRAQKNAMMLLAREITLLQNKLSSLRRELSFLILTRHIFFRQWREKNVEKKIRAAKKQLDRFVTAQKSLEKGDAGPAINLLDEMIREIPYFLNALGGSENGSLFICPPAVNPSFKRLLRARRQLSKA